MTDLVAHPLADAFPLIEGQEYEDMQADVRARGLVQPIILYQGMILDGRNRYRCCLATGVTVHFKHYHGDDPAGFVISLNMRRRHLTISQRALIATTLANLGRGRPGENPPRGGISAERAAALMQVSPRSIERARAVQEQGAPELVAAVKGGNVTVATAAAFARELSPLEQAAIVQASEREILAKAKEINARRNTERRNARIGRIETMTQANAPIATDRKFPIIYGDPAWRFEAGDSDRSIENHYPTMTLAQICALPVADLATPDALYLLWVINPCLGQGFDVLRAHGFTYKSNYVWTKDKMGLGYWNREQHEILLIATRGDFPAPAPPDRRSSVFPAPRRAHSQKPDEVAEWIERAYPTLPKIELFCRSPRPGWAVWGNQSAGHAVAGAA